MSIDDSDSDHDDFSHQPIFSTFEAMGINKDLLRGIYAYGIERPSDIQAKAIVPCIEGRDVIMQAKSGMGKTLIFAIAILQRIDQKLRKCQAILIEPTRELARQNQKVLVTYAKYMRVRCQLAIGGNYFKSDASAAQSGPHVLVCTIGKLAHLMREQFLDSSHLKILVLDEFDDLMKERQLKSEIIDEITSQSYQKICVSATTSEMALKESKKMMVRPLVFTLKTSEMTLEGIRQYYIEVANFQDKVNTLYSLLTSVKGASGFIFCNHRNMVLRVREALYQIGLDVPFTHGRIDNSFRHDMMSKVRSGEVKFVLTSDLMSRGIDVQQMNMVINFELPVQTIRRKTYLRDEQYIHRIGRCGRYGRKGMAITLVFTNQLPMVEELQKIYSTQITPIGDNGQVGSGHGFSTLDAIGLFDED